MPESIFATSIVETRNSVNSINRINNYFDDWLNNEGALDISYAYNPHEIFNKIRFRDLNETAKYKFIKGFKIYTKLRSTTGLTNSYIMDLLEATNPIISEGNISVWRNTQISRAVYYANKHTLHQRENDLMRTRLALKY